MSLTVQAVIVICFLFPGLLYLREANKYSRLYFYEDSKFSAPKTLTVVFVTSIVIHSLLFLLFYFIYFGLNLYDISNIPATILSRMKSGFESPIKNGHDTLFFAFFLIIYTYLSSAFGKSWGTRSANIYPSNDSNHNWATPLIRSVRGMLEETYVFVYTSQITDDGGRIIYTGELKNFLIDSYGNFQYVIITDVKKTNSKRHAYWKQNGGKNPWDSVRRNNQSILHIEGDDIFNIYISPEYIYEKSDVNQTLKRKENITFAKQVLIHVGFAIFLAVMGALIAWK